MFITTTAGKSLNNRTQSQFQFQSMPGNWKLERNGRFSNSGADRVEEGMRRLKMEISDGNGRLGDEQPGQGGYPERQGEPDCIYYLRTGSCGYGSNCRFNHPSDGIGGQVDGAKNTNELPERAGLPDCGFYVKTGTCKYGSTCKYNHPKNRQTDSLVLNILGLPMREDANPCVFFMRNGTCKFGSTCKYHHPQPTTTTGNVLPVPVYGAAGSTVVPSGAPSVGDLSATNSLSQATYVSSSHFQIPQSYMPLVYSPSPAWNTYMGSLGPLPMPSILNAPVSNGQLSVSQLPERPDQPECRYFMNNGSCKYGPDCKYHHPRDKIPEVAFSSLGPLGLPLRPGHRICSYYSSYGICKYGPTCKFDHPLDGYSYAYSFNVPPLAASYSPYQTTPSLIQSSDTSPSKSLNLSDWIKTGATSSTKNQLSNTNSLADSPDRSDSPPRSPKSSSEFRQDESD